MEVIQVALSTAERIRAHFETPLDTEDVAALIEAAFWASLRREEGYVPRISLALVAPDEVRDGMRFEKSLPLTAEPLTKLSGAAERPGIHLGVWREGGELRVGTSPRPVMATRLIVPEEQLRAAGWGGELP